MEKAALAVVRQIRDERAGLLGIIVPFAHDRAERHLEDQILATWAGAAATVADPLDPIILQETLADVLAGAR